MIKKHNDNYYSLCKGENMAIAYIGLGSNLGDRLSYIQQACKLLNDIKGVYVTQSSSIYETEPCDYKNQDWFINAVIEIQTKLSPAELLCNCQRIEKILGRTNHPEAPRWGPRTIDIDILFFEDFIISEYHLEIPHPRLHSRACMLVPLLEVNESFIHPIFGKTIQDLHSELLEPEEVYLYGTRQTTQEVKSFFIQHLASLELLILLTGSKGMNLIFIYKKIIEYFPHLMMQIA